MATIKYGMKGDDVKKLQTALNDAGYNIDIDGSFGSQTLDAVKRYQKANNLTVDGLVGSQTQNLLFGATTGSTSGNTSTNYSNTGTTVNTGTTTNTSNTSTSTPSTTTGSGSSTSSGITIDYPDAYVPGTYTYTDPSQSETVLAAKTALDSILAQQPGAYQAKWQDQINDIINQYQNRKFSYDFNEDALYKQYAEQYTRLGKLAMQDTMGQAAAMTGGYGNSYASTAGNQAYQQYLSQLNDVIPELYGMALNRYQMEGQDMYNQYSMLSAQEQQAYARYMDKYNQWLTERGYYTDAYNTAYDKAVDDRNFEYGMWADAEDRRLQAYQTELQKAEAIAGLEMDRKRLESEENRFNTTMEYNEAKDKRNEAADRVNTSIENGVMPSTEDCIAAGFDPKQVQAIYNNIVDAKANADSEKLQAAAMEMIKFYIAADMEVPTKLQKQAGLTDDDLAALTANYQSGSGSKSGAGNTDEGTKYVTDSGKIDDWSTAILGAETEEEALRYAERLEQLDPELAFSLYEQWLREHGGDYIDTTVTNTTVKNNNPNLTGGGGGKIMVRY